MTDEEKLKQQCAELMERIMATIVAGNDPKPLQKQLKRLAALLPPEKNHGSTES